MLYGVLAYMAIGFVIGLGRVSRGIQGSVGPAGTLLAWSVIWPLFLLSGPKK